MPYSRFFSKCKVVLAALSTLVATVPPLPMQSSAIAPPPLPPDAAYPAPPPADFEQQTKKGDFSIKLAPTVAPIEKVTPIKVVAAEKIDAHRVQEILKRMPPFHEDEKAPAFVLPEQALVRPQIPGTTVEQAFPPSNSAKRPNESVAGPLKILRINQSGQVDNVRELAIVFSQPMVPLTDLGTVNNQSDIPVRLTPQPKGVWKWTGTQALTFQPTTAKRLFPKATDYRVELLSSAKSVLNSKPAKAETMRFETPAAKVVRFAPSGESGQSLSPTMVAIFDQDISPDRVLKSISIKADHSGSFAVELVPTAAVRASKDFKDIIGNVREQQIFAFKTKSPLPQDSKIRVTLQACNASAEGPKLSAMREFSFRTHGQFKLIKPRGHEEYEDLTSYSLEFTNPVDKTKLPTSALTISPELPELKVEGDGTYLTITGRFQPLTKYTVNFNPGITDVFAQKLVDRSFSFTTGKCAPYITSANRFLIVIPQSKTPTYKIHAQGLKAIKVTLVRPDLEDSIRILAASSSRGQIKSATAAKNAQTLSKVYQVGPGQVDIDIDLTPMLRNGFGSMLLYTEPVGTKKFDDNDYGEHIAWIQVTDIGIDAYTDLDTLVQATSLKDGAPLKGVELQTIQSAWSSKRSKLTVSAHAVTDAKGLARLTKPGETDAISYLLGKRGDDVAVTECQRVWRNASSDNELRWSIETDRNLYRPGEKVQVKGWVRGAFLDKKAETTIFTPKLTNINWSGISQDQHELAKGKTTLDSSGGFSFDFTIPEHVQLGPGAILLQAVPALIADKDSTNIVRSDITGIKTAAMFTIQEFRRPEFEMTVKSSEGNSIFLGEATKLTADAKYFAGGPLPNTPIDWIAKGNYTNYAPPNRSEFVFGDAPILYFGFGASLANPYESETVQIAKDQTDSTGKSCVELKAENSKKALPISIRCEATAKDVNRQAWSDEVTMLVHPADVYVGVKLEKMVIPKDETIKLKTIVTDIDGKSVAHRKVKLEVCSLVEKSEAKRVLVSRDLESIAEAASIDLGKQPGGTYELHAEVTDEKGRKSETRTSFWIDGSEFKPTKTVDQQQVTLIPDKQEYKVGDVAEISVFAPFAGSHGLVTVTQRHAMSQEPIEQQQSNFKVRLPVTESFYPQINVKLDLVGHDCVYASGATVLKVPPTSKELQLSVEPEKTELAPGGETTLRVSLKTADGKPAFGNVAVVVVDDAILATAKYAWTNPLNNFYPVQNSDIAEDRNRTLVILPETNQSRSIKHKSENFDKFRGGFGGSIATRAAAPMAAPAPPPMPMEAPVLQGATNGTIVSDDSSVSVGAPIKMRSDFSALALFEPSITTDGAGEASVKLHLPESLTRYRIMALASVGESQFGKSESHVTARLPLMVKPSAPRFLNLGDRCELPVILQNQTDSNMKVEVVARADNALLGNNETAVGKLVDVPSNDRIEVRFPTRPRNIGTARFQLGGIANELSDAAEISLPVLKPASMESFATYGQIEQGAAEQKVVAPHDALGDIGGLTIATSSTAVQGLADAYFYLHDYEFECSEQISSRMLSMLALKDVLKAFGTLQTENEPKFKQTIEQGIKTLLSRQRSDGSFGLWKLEERSDFPYCSIQVCRALSIAKTSGFSVPDQSLASCTKFLKSVDTKKDSKGKDLKYDRALRAYALFVRYLQQDADSASANRLLHDALRSAKSSSADLENVSLDSLQSQLSLESACWLLPVLASDKSLTSECKLINRFIAGSITETASTASIAKSGYGDDNYCLFYSPRRENAVVLDALIRTEPKSDLIVKIAKGLLAHRIKGKWEGTQENCTVLLALSNYFKTYENVTPKFEAQAWLGDTFIGSHNFSGRSSESATLALPISYLKDKGSQSLLINKAGSGRLYYRVGMDYAPASFDLQAADYGFTVNRTYQGLEHADDARKDSAGVWHFKAGAPIKSKISFSNPGLRYHVALMDPLAAGTEAVNQDLGGSQKMFSINENSSDTSTDNNNNNEIRPFFWWWNWPWYEHQSLRDHQAEAFTPLLNAGSHEYSYIMRATTPGAYIVPPCKAEEMYQPETFGRSATDRVVVE